MNSKEVRWLRQQLRLTQAQLAKKLGVTRVTVARWETGQHGIRESAALLLLYLAKKRLTKDMLRPLLQLAKREER